MVAKVLFVKAVRVDRVSCNYSPSLVYVDLWAVEANNRETIGKWERVGSGHFGQDLRT